MHATARGLVRACHPEPTLAVTAVAAGIAVTAGRPPWGVLLVAAAVLTGQLSVGWLNDYLDAARDREVGRADKPIATGLVEKRIVGAAAWCAGAACVPLSLSTGVLAGGVHLVAVVSAWAYDAGVKSTRLSVLPYGLSFGLLPVFVVLTSGQAPPWWLFTAGALLGSGAHFANALPDLADDARTGVHGLPHLLGPRWSSRAAVALLLGAMVCLVVGPEGGPSLAGLSLFAAACLVLAFALIPRRGSGSRALFRAIMAVALLAVVLLLITPL
ncbi:UbiA family prenyltransferase [Amycolatopsis sp. NPDC023774]|uniref:UbiA family prenyltransferase n=1 Tax=Amycolatopsis sp. NPDC023774 TaxID=3155015 RepID=UPI0033CA427F